MSICTHGSVWLVGGSIDVEMISRWKRLLNVMAINWHGVVVIKNGWFWSLYLYEI
jgi:hypothetical protein